MLPQNLLMIDCEMTGLIPHEDDILQVAALLLELRDDTQYHIVREFNKFCHNKKTPVSTFQKTYLSDIYFECNNSTDTYETTRFHLEEFLSQHLGTITPCGDCVATDLDFLYAKNIIKRNHFENDTPVLGTFHYENFELNSIKAVARHKIGSAFDKALPLDKGIHNALTDCRNQLLELNAFIKVLVC